MVQWWLILAIKDQVYEDPVQTLAYYKPYLQGSCCQQSLPPSMTCSLPCLSRSVLVFHCSRNSGKILCCMKGRDVNRHCLLILANIFKCLVHQCLSFLSLSLLDLSYSVLSVNSNILISESLLYLVYFILLESSLISLLGL